MNDHSFEIVRFALALHLEVVPDAIVGSDSLAEDLGLDPLDLVLVVLRLEELAEAEFPVADLVHTRTVDDLVSLVREWAQDSQRAPRTYSSPGDRVVPSHEDLQNVQNMFAVTSVA